MQQKTLKFYSKSKEAKCLSNFADIPVQINDKHYISGEHAFHGQKYIFASNIAKTEERKKLLLEYAKKFEGETTHFKSSLDAKKGGGKRGCILEKDELFLWDSKLSYDIQKIISLYKLNNNNDVKKILQENKNSYILHQDNRAKNDCLWGGRLDANNNLIGQNKLGKIWMQIAKDL
jgi:predicted NAD-dependent protein-ADP-ribosyltransferase YbiA (DUF1768 family)